MVGGCSHPQKFNFTYKNLHSCLTGNGLWYTFSEIFTLHPVSSPGYSISDVYVICFCVNNYLANCELCRVGGALGDTTPARLVICVDWAKVDEHMARVSRSKTRIHLDPECLRWTPLVTTVPNPFQEEEKEVCALC
jgi:hypothetical protein